MTGLLKSTGSPTGKRARVSAPLRLVPGAGSDFPPTVSKRELLDPGGKSDRRFRQFLYDFSVLGSYIERARAYLAGQLGISPSEYNILMVIAQYQGRNGIGVTQIARHLHSTTAFITSEVRKLEGIGFVSKRRNPSDGRGVLLKLTPPGSSRVRSIGRKRLFVNDQLFRSLSGRDFQNLSRITASLIDDFADTIEALEAMDRKDVRRSEMA